MLAINKSNAAGRHSSEAEAILRVWAVSVLPSQVQSEALNFRTEQLRYASGYFRLSIFDVV